MSGTQPTADTSPKGKGRRRSQRFYLLIPLEVMWATKENAQIKEPAETEEVNAHGALLRAEHDLPVRGVIALKQGTATNWAMARVARCCPARPDGQTQVAVELTVPSEAFWGVLFWSGV